MTYTFTSQPDETAGVDTYLNSFAPTNNYATSAQIYVGQAGSSVGRILIKFDLSSITFPANGVVESATLSLWVRSDSSSNPRNFLVYRVLRNWVENQATWNAWTTGNNWTTSGCGSAGNDYDSVVWATTAFTATEAAGTEKQFLLNTGEMAKILDGTNPNYGWVIRADTENADQYGFDSATAGTSSTRPKLVIVYRSKKKAGVIGSI